MRDSQLNNRIDDWLASRPWHLLWYCLPVLLIGMFTLLLVYVLYSQPKNAFQHRYDSLAKQLLASGRFEEARVACLRGLSDAKNERDTAQWLYSLAVALNGLGNIQQAQALVKAAAPLDHPGSLPAHLLMARSLLSSTNLTARAIREAQVNPTNTAAIVLHMAERHLLNALVLDPDSLEVNEALGRYYINVHQLAKARSYLMKIFSAKPDTALLLAISADLDNDAPSAIQWSDRAVVAFEQNLIKSAPKYNYGDRDGLVEALGIKSKYTTFNPTRDIMITNDAPEDSPLIWLGIVHLLLIKGKYAPAMATLDQQMLSNSNALFSAAIGELSAAWAQSIPPNQPGASAARLRLVEKGLKNAPDNLILQLLLVQIAQGTDDSAAEAKALLDQKVAAATGPSAALWEFIFWTDGRIHGDMIAARKHLQKAYQLAPTNPRIENDQALDLAGGSPVDQERALKIIQNVVDRFPYDASYRDSRGQILARLGRYPEAKADLEYASLRLPSPVETRRVLAKVYAAMGIVPEKIATDQLSEASRLVKAHKFETALDVLDKANLANPNSAYDSAIADVCIAGLQAMPLNSPDRVKLIEKGLVADPGNEQLHALAVQATHAPGELGKSARRLLDQAVTASVGEAAAQWHLFLGRDARSSGDLAAARREFSAAYTLSPKSTQIQIELAVILADGNQPDLQQAFQLIQPVVEQFPNDPNFVFTRGKILARLGRFPEALPDLEFAAPRLPDNREARLQLASVYEALGRPKDAEAQRRLAKQKTSM